MGEEGKLKWTDRKCEVVAVKVEGSREVQGWRTRRGLLRIKLLSPLKSAAAEIYSRDNCCAPISSLGLYNYACSRITSKPDSQTVSGI